MLPQDILVSEIEIVKKGLINRLNGHIHVYYHNPVGKRIQYDLSVFFFFFFVFLTFFFYLGLFNLHLDQIKQKPGSPVAY